jgi:phage shock protein PspC (stress-responsive transcriptional regulator)
MKKTFTININGSVFHIEDEAYEKLREYLKLLNRYFSTQEGGSEILQDIESRIAELLQEKITEKNEVVTMGWVDEIMHRMGNPEDFSEQEKTARPSEPEKKKKRLYRDKENRVLGGVCSGLGTYLNIDPVFIRILIVLIALLGVGISAVFYLILWIVVPEAKTTSQRLEMRGMEATISNIQNTIQEEVKEVKESFSTMTQSEAIKNGKKVARNAGRATMHVLKGLGKIAGIIFGSLLIIAGFAGFLAFLFSLTAGNSLMDNGSGADLSGMLGFMVTPGLASVSILLLVFLIGIPLLAILFIGTKLVFKYNTNNKLIGLGALAIWLIALISIAAISAGQLSNFSQKSSVSSGMNINYSNCQTLYLELGEQFTNDEVNTRFDNYSVIVHGNEQVLAGIPQLRIETTDAKDFSLVIRKQSRGKNSGEIQNFLNQISYETISKDSTLFLNSFFTIGGKAKWRGQEVQLILKVPTGKKVHLGNKLNQLHLDFDNLNNIWVPEMAGKTWLMTPEGLSLSE